MFFIFGWGHPKVEDLGPVQQRKCEHCHNTEIWQLKTRSSYFTLFFIPIFPHDVQHFYHCPICNHGILPDKEDFAGYKAIAQANINCLEGRITEEERLVLLDKIDNQMRAKQEDENQKAKQGSTKWVSVVNEKTTSELERILGQHEQEYDPSFIIAVKEEIQKRKGAAG